MALIISFSALHNSFIISNYYSILSPGNHSFYIGIHKQADKVSGYGFFGKLFYNKYVVIAKSLTDKMAYYLDWDYWAFANVSGKYGNTSGLPALSMVSIFELPFILVGAFLSVKKLSRELLYFLIVVFCLAVTDSFTVLLPIFLIYLIYFFMAGFGVLKKAITGNTGSVIIFVLMVLIVVSRISLLDQAGYEIGRADSRYFVYQEISNYLKGNNSDIILTDRLGLPDIYLTYFNTDHLPQLIDSLKTTRITDSEGYKKSVNLGTIYFSSVNSKCFETEKKEVLTGKSYLELEEYLPDFPGTDITYFKTNYFYVTADKEITTRLKMVKFKW